MELFLPKPEYMNLGTKEQERIGVVSITIASIKPLKYLFLVPTTFDAETLMHLITKKGMFPPGNIAMF